MVNLAPIGLITASSDILNDMTIRLSRSLIVQFFYESVFKTSVADLDAVISVGGLLLLTNQFVSQYLCRSALFL